MRLKVFNFVDEVIEELEVIKGDLEEASFKLEKYFEDMLVDENVGYINSTSRVKSSVSLREKILRNEYYKKYKKPNEVLDNLSDLIGIRIECRFINDEKNIYKYIKKRFKSYDYKGFYYSRTNPHIKLQLKTNQPEEQKNGFKIYRIDGKYEYLDNIFNFELQIKSIVNMFWGDIEHKIIYKNYNYMLNDNFFKEIMGSIKNNLTMIDNQLLVIDDYFNRQNTSDVDKRKEQVESLLAKIVYDVFSTKMKDSLGFIIDFRKACDILIKYVATKNSLIRKEEYNSVLINLLSRLNEVAKEDVNFNEEIIFERGPVFVDKFSNVLGERLITSINEELQWNLFFRILFAIEPMSNVEDFENFIKFIKDMFIENEGFRRLDERFKDDSVYVREDIMEQVAICFSKIDAIDFLYNNNISKVVEFIEEICELIVNNNEDYTEFVEFKDIYYGLLEISVLSVFGEKVKTDFAMEFIKKVKHKSESIIVSNEVLKYINTLESIEEINADDILTIFRTK